MHEKTTELFTFGRGAKELVDVASRFGAHFFAKNSGGDVLAANDIQAEFFGAGSTDNFIGQNYADILPKSEIDVLISNDLATMYSSSPRMFYESGLNQECLTVKGKTYDSSNSIVGVAGLACYFSQMTLKNSVDLMNEIFGLTSFHADYERNSLVRFPCLNVLTKRERDCVRLLSYSMTYKEIGGKLSLSPRTIESHMNSIKNKLNCYSRSGIIEKVFGQKPR